MTKISEARSGTVTPTVKLIVTILNVLLKVYIVLLCFYLLFSAHFWFIFGGSFDLHLFLYNFLTQSQNNVL